MKKISKKSFKKVLAFIGGTAFIALCVYNVSLGLSDYGKRSTSLLTLEALADGEGSSSEIAVCLQIHVVQHNRLATTGTPKQYCWHITGPTSAVKEGTIYSCTNSGAVSGSECNATSCKSSNDCMTQTTNPKNN
jgi:hypothetical protein